MNQTTPPPLNILEQAFEAMGIEVVDVTPNTTQQDHSHLWNDLTFEERKRMMPYQIELHIRHLEQARRIMVAAHRKCLADIDDVISNCRNSLWKEENGRGS
jgi:predicted nuclease with RNAse H fold